MLQLKQEVCLAEDNIKVDMVILDQGNQKQQDTQILGDSILEKLPGVAKKYWTYKSEKLVIIIS